jgi:hypothetical protein
MTMMMPPGVVTRHPMTMGAAEGCDLVRFSTGGRNTTGAKQDSEQEGE